MHEPGSLSWACLWSLNHTYVCHGQLKAYWDVDRKELCWSQTQDAVAVTGDVLTGWTIEIPASEPEPETEDVPIEEFDARGASALSWLRRGCMRSRIVCYLYPKGGGSYREFCTDRAWMDWAGALYHQPQRGIAGDWAQATHVRLRKEAPASE